MFASFLLSFGMNKAAVALLQNEEARMLVPVDLGVVDGHAQAPVLVGKDHGMTAVIRKDRGIKVLPGSADAIADCGQYYVISFGDR